MAKKKDREGKALRAIAKAVKKALSKGIPESIIEQTVGKALARGDGDTGAAPVNKVSKPAPRKTVQKAAKAKKSADVTDSA